MEKLKSKSRDQKIYGTITHVILILGGILTLGPFLDVYDVN